MGHSQAAGMAEAVRDGHVTLRQALEWHLQSNHYPPLPRSQVISAGQAIEAVQGGSPEVPVGISLGGGRIVLVEAERVVKALHLEAFLEETDV